MAKEELISALRKNLTGKLVFCALFVLGFALSEDLPRHPAILGCVVVTVLYVILGDVISLMLKPRK